MDDSFIEKRDKSLYEGIAVDYARKDRVEGTAYARKFMALSAVLPIFKKIPNLGLLYELACGAGATAQHLRGRYTRYIGIDYAEPLIECAREFNRTTKNAEFVVMNVKDIADSALPKADCMLVTGALHHFTELDQVLESLKKKAQPGAYFIAVEPHRGNPLIQFLRFVRGKVDSAYSEDQRFFAKEELRLLFSQHGFTDIEFEYQGYFSPPFAQIILQPQLIFSQLSRIAVSLDGVLDRILPTPMKIISWNIIIHARFPVR